MEIRLNATTFDVPAPTALRPVVVRGTLLRTAEIHEEEWLSDAVIGDFAAYVDALRASPARIDVFTFAQKPPHTAPRYPFPHEMDNVAAIHTARFDEWWKALPQAARKNARRASRRGIVVRPFPLDNAAVSGIVEIYNEVPVRQGRPFAHYGKSAATVAGDLSALADTSEFVGAFYGDELVGFIKLVHMGEITGILHIVSKQRHYDKRPSNALVTAAAEICRDRNVSYLTYGKFQYGNKTNSLLTEFKRRTGFEKIAVPRYYLSLTLRGRAYVALGLHKGLIGLLPPGVLHTLLGVRARVVNAVWGQPKSVKPSDA